MICNKCGAENSADTFFCEKCGSPLLTPTPDQSPTSQSTIRLQSNIAGLLCYVLGWLTGLILFLIEKDDQFVRFHAMQSLVTFGALTVAMIGLSILALIPYIGLLFGLLQIAIVLLGFVLWIVSMVKAYQNEEFKIPWAGDFAGDHI